MRSILGHPVEFEVVLKLTKAKTQKANKVLQSDGKRRENYQSQVSALLFNPRNVEINNNTHSTLYYLRYYTCSNVVTVFKLLIINNSTILMNIFM